MKVWSVEWPDGLLPVGADWEKVTGALAATRNDIVVTNEMPFGWWLPTRLPFDGHKAKEWAGQHERGLEALATLPVRAIVSSRPIVVDGKLVNEAFAMIGGRYRFLHQKHFFPSENGWQESGWFHTQRPGFEVHDIAGLSIGVLLCTELMFTDRARQLGRSGADVIAVPRATGTDHRMWRTAASMAAIVSGSCVISSNRVGQRDTASPRFGGGGIVVDADGCEVAMTSRERPAISYDVDTTLTKAAKFRYPVYVDESALT
ncbi:carbon-nitrogen hydrolase family protein [Rhizobium leguminosarum]|uniref:carbon-nitrogen hydrolase family protein n=1 Tax=Rhizobium leguminosarum TaxID=384 RepID=UPI000480AE59|nr:carbon-nitrogen hydrolase family protein [Rhizobium leguminosarum]